MIHADMPMLVQGVRGAFDSEQVPRSALRYFSRYCNNLNLAGRKHKDFILASCATVFLTEPGSH
jgi:hypothetical protein